MDNKDILIIAAIAAVFLTSSQTWQYRNKYLHSQQEVKELQAQINTIERTLLMSK